MHRGQEQYHGLIDCGNWLESAAWPVPGNAVSGVYFARLTLNDTGGASYVFFNIRDDNRNAEIIYQRLALASLLCVCRCRCSTSLPDAALYRVHSLV